jgi:hypothetical protein
MRTKLIVGFLLIVLVNFGCQSEGSTVTDFVPYSSTTVGLTVSHPESWATEETGAEMIVASNTAVIETQQYENSAAVIAFIEPQSQIGPDLIQFLTEQIVGADTAFVVEQPTATTINGREAATVLMSRPQNDLDLFLGTTLIQGDGQVIFVLTVYDSQIAAEVEPTLTEIVGTIDFYEEGG